MSSSLRSQHSLYDYYKWLFTWDSLSSGKNGVPSKVTVQVTWHYGVFQITVVLLYYLDGYRTLKPECK
ncbi:hypothetical protein XELAEV_18046171mg [Xenopus laevis]|uniref:Uncharacterized protein n=1 Tax=Xenopus laevis TaxID=8355 RepID=A0A974H0C8_XENLA|nr:hypothetical protein XELAEV_18046171mg [Xenopus laevis]